MTIELATSDDLDVVSRVIASRRTSSSSTATREVPTS